jgi:hypothetical protein
MPNYPSSFDGGSAPGQRAVNNVTSRRDFEYFQKPSVGSAAGFAVSVATAAVLPNSAVGLGTTGIICGASGNTLIVDGVSLISTSSVVLVKDQGTATQNGVYTLTTVGAVGTSWILTRDSRFNSNGEFKKNTILSSTFGTANASLKFFISNEEPVVIGTTNISFSAVPTTVSFNSAAKYPTDNTVGTQDVGTLGSAYASNTLADLKSMLNIMENDIAALETSFAGTNASTSYAIAYMANAQLLTINNLHSKMEKMVFEIARLKDDVDRMETVGFGAVFPGIGLTSRYPSGSNRLTNTAGGF